MPLLNQVYSKNSMNTYLQYLLTGASLGTAFGVAFAYFKRGSRNETGEIVDFYKKQATDYKEMLEVTRKEYTQKHEDLLAQVGALRGELNTEKRLREQYEAILKDKNPETEAFMKLMVQSVKDQSEVNKEIVGVLKEIHAMSKAEHERDFNISATVTKI